MVHDNAGDDTNENNNETSSNDNPTLSSDDDLEKGQDEYARSDAESNEERSQEVPQLRRSTRERILSIKYNLNEYITLTDEGEPQSYEKAMADSHMVEWVKAMQEKMKSLCNAPRKGAGAPPLWMPD